MRLNHICVLLKDCGVDQLILLGCFELHTVLIDELLLHLLKFWINQNLLNTSYNLIEVIVIWILISTIHNFKLLFIIFPSKSTNVTT